MIERKDKRYVKRKVEDVSSLVKDITERFYEALFDENDNRSYQELFKLFNEEYVSKATLLNKKNMSKLQANPYAFYLQYYPVETT